MYEFVESRLFERMVYEYLDEESYSAMQAWLAHSPQSGDLVPGSGGCRNLRWQTVGKGKRGGA